MGRTLNDLIEAIELDFSDRGLQAEYSIESGYFQATTQEIVKDLKETTRKALAATRIRRPDIADAYLARLLELARALRSRKELFGGWGDSGFSN